MLGKKTSKIN